ncbi:cytochrome P450 monooxygenase protein [Rutstroemia sp. NJR-2017a WRK4]|nr:cytochrome P450 monooxygenase protein [Rutstroemia sp. NJR-2017a WRK4]
MSRRYTESMGLLPGHLPFPKDPVWWATQPGHPESLISAGPDDHARMRKLLHHGFTPRALKTQEPILHKYVSLLVDRLSERAMETPDGDVLDIVPWFNYTTFDIFGDLGFGESFDCLQHSRYHPWITLLFNSVKAAGFVIAARFYPWVEELLMKLIPKSLKKMQDDHFQQIKDKVNRRLNWELERPDLMSHVIKHNGTDKELEGMTFEEIQVTFMILTTAGSETTATVLSGTMNYLMSHRDIYAKLVKEIRGTFASETQITLEALEQLEYLNAVIQEGIRLCPPVPVMLPRIVPEGGDTVCGLWMPAGTSVSLQSWTLLRDPKCFHDATAFIPERWLSEATQPNSPYAQDERQAVQAFSAGPRVCMGRHLAWAELRLILARLLWSFDLEGAGELLHWDQLRTFLLVEKKPLEIRIRMRSS